VEAGGQIGRDQVRPVFLGAPRPHLGLEVAHDEGVEQVVGDGEQQGAGQQGVGVVLVAVVAVPLVAQFVESLVFDSPAAVVLW
jgi:hypothetical protein